MKNKLPRYDFLNHRPFLQPQRDAFSWNKNNYANMVESFYYTGTDNNDTSIVQSGLLLRVPNNIFVFRTATAYTGGGSWLNDNCRLGDLFDLDLRLGEEFSNTSVIPKNRAFVCWGQSNEEEATHSRWLQTVTPRHASTPFDSGEWIDLDAEEFKGGKFVGIIDQTDGYNFLDPDGSLNHFETDLARLEPFIDLFEQFNVFVTVHDLDLTILAMERDGNEDAVPELEIYYADTWDLLQTQCTLLSDLGFETIEPDYTTILNRIKELWEL